MSIGVDWFIKEQCYKATILQRNYKKMTILWSFSYKSFEKFHVIMKCVIKGQYCTYQNVQFPTKEHQMPKYLSLC